MSPRERLDRREIKQLDRLHNLQILKSFWREFGEFVKVLFPPMTIDLIDTINLKSGLPGDISQFAFVGLPQFQQNSEILSKGASTSVGLDEHCNRREMLM